MYIPGAFKSILESQNRSQEAQARVDGTGDTIAKSADIRALVEDLIAQKENELETEKDTYENRLQAVDNQLTGLESRLAEINEQVCAINETSRNLTLAILLFSLYTPRHDKHHKING